MSIKKEKAFAQLKKDFSVFSNIVFKQLRQLESIINSESNIISEEVYETINKQEKEIDKFELKITEEVITTIVLYSPVANELRQLMALNRMTANLEKIGDLIINIIKDIRKIDDEKLYTKLLDTINDILIISISMVEKSLFAFKNNDMDYAIWTIKNDDIVDEIHHSFIKKIIKKNLLNVKSQEEVSTLIRMMTIVSNIERIADKATNIAEAAIFSTMGKDVRHKDIDKI